MMPFTGRPRCLRFKMYLCCDHRVTLTVYTAVNGELSASPLLTINNHQNRWRDVQQEVNARGNTLSPEPIEVNGLCMNK